MNVKQAEASGLDLSKIRPLAIAVFVLVAVDQILALTGIRDAVVGFVDGDVFPALNAIDPLVVIPMWWSSLHRCVSSSSDWLVIAIRLLAPSGSNCFIQASILSLAESDIGVLGFVFFIVSYVLAFFLLLGIVTDARRSDPNFPIMILIVIATPFAAIPFVFGFKLLALLFVIIVKFTLVASVLIGALYKIWEQLADLRKVTTGTIQLVNPFRPKRTDE